MCQLFSKAIQRVGILNSWIWLANRVLETGPVLYSPDRSPDVFRVIRHKALKSEIGRKE